MQFVNLAKTKPQESDMYHWQGKGCYGGYTYYSTDINPETGEPYGFDFDPSIPANKKNDFDVYWLDTNIEEDITIFADFAYSKIPLDIYNIENIFKNVEAIWESCDCYDDFCRHPNYISGFKITNADKVYNVEIEDGDRLFISDYSSRITIPVEGATVYDFIRMCQLCGVEL